MLNQRVNCHTRQILATLIASQPLVNNIYGEHLAIHFGNRVMCIPLIMPSFVNLIKGLTFHSLETTFLFVQTSFCCGENVALPFRFFNVD
jgi:hypothetical protein